MRLTAEQSLELRVSRILAEADHMDSSVLQNDFSHCNVKISCSSLITESGNSVVLLFCSQF